MTNTPRTYEDAIFQALDDYRTLANREPSRELSLIITKLEEASHWVNRYREIRGLPMLSFDATWKL